MYRKKDEGWTKHIDFIMLDIICLELSFFLAYILRHQTRLTEEYKSFMGVIVIIDLLTMFILRSYSGVIWRGYMKETLQVVKHNTVLIAGLIIYLFLEKDSAVYSRLVFSYFYIISICVMVPARLVWKRIIRRRREKNRKRRVVAVVTEYTTIKELAQDLKKQYYRDYQVLGVAVVNRNTEEKEIEGLKVLADADNIYEFFKDHVVDEVLINLSSHSSLENELSTYFLNSGITVHISLGKFGQNLRNKKLDEFAGYTVVTESISIVSAVDMTLKRILDIAGACVGLLLTGIAFVIFAPIIYLQSPGPIFFSQERVGRHGRLFRIYKFRSMYLDAEEKKAMLMKENKMNGYMFKMDHDPRIIPIGHFMRKYSIDELPQFWNILKGDMSLVGTRPPTVDEVEKYELHHRKRLAFKPGLTGMWQISGRSSITDFEEVVALDTQYLAEWSFLLDVKILLKTVVVVLKGTGAS